MSGRWFHNEGDRVVGPVTLDDVETYLIANFRDDVLVWTDGMASWEPARTVPAFDTLYREPPPLPEVAPPAPEPPAPEPERAKQFVPTPPPLNQKAGGPQTSWRPTPEATSVGQPMADPWFRFLARAVDLTIYFSFFAFLIGFPARNVGFFEIMLFSMLATLGFCFVEAIVLGIFGTTIGKWVFSIMIVPRLTWTQVWDRAFSVWVRGIGLGIPFVSLFTLAMSHQDVISNGVTAWDRDYHSRVVQLRMRFWRWMAFLAGVYALWWVIETRSGI